MACYTEGIFDTKSQRFFNRFNRFTLTTFLISWVSLSQTSFITWRCSASHYSLAFKSFFLKQPVISIMWIYCSTLYSVQVNHLFIFTHTAHCPLVFSFVNLYNRSWSQKVLAFRFTTVVWIVALLLNFKHACQFRYRSMLGFLLELRYT